jgi:MFS family permease
MNFAPYRHVLALPGIRALLLVGVFARIPATAIGITLTLHVANTLGRSWAEAGLATAAFTIGAAVGSPLMGRLIDRRGMRTVMVLTGMAGAVIWTIAPHLSYPALLAASVVGGLLGIPIFAAIRLGLAAMVPSDQRRPAFALDSMIVELSFMVGPAVAVVFATSLPPGYGLYVLAGGLAVTAMLMYALNPPTRPEGHELPAVAPSRRTWFGSRLISLMIAGTAATFILSATDLSIVATLRDAGAVRWTGVAIALWCAYSLIGGLIFGAVHWSVSALALIAAMGLLTIPVGLAPSWHWLLLALIPCGLLCAPTMTATNDDLARVVPAESRGEATGLLASAFTAGVAIGAPFAGLVIDHAGPAWSFAAAGAVGAIAVLAAVPAYRRSPVTQSGGMAPQTAVAAENATV